MIKGEIGLSSIFSEAFKKLSVLNEEEFNIDNKEDMEDAKGFLDMVDDDTDTVVFDVDAPSKDDLLDSYVGKVILDCCVCHSKIFQNPEDVVVDETGELANVDTECPYCYSNDGYKVIGKVVSADDEISTDKGEDNDDIEIEVSEKEKVEEKPDKKDKVEEKLETKKDRKRELR